MGIYGKLLRYNVRICAGLGAWLIVVPVAATMLVLFALMAMRSVLNAGTAPSALEVLAPILLAFLGANLLRPEYQYATLETALARPVSFRVILTVRVLVAGVGVLVLTALLGWFMRSVMHLELNVALAMLAVAASTAFLTALAIAVAAAWRSPALGIGAAAAYWALDLAVGARLNPLLTLRGYGADRSFPDDVWDTWWIGKAVLAAVALVLVVYAGKAAARPASQRTLGRLVRTGVGVLAIGVVYLGSGAWYKVQWGVRHEAVLLAKSRLWYREAFKPYGPLPVAYLVGPSFAHFVGYRAPWTRLPPSTGAISRERLYDEQQLSLVAFGPSDNRWADNALFELGRRAPKDAEEAAASPDYARLGIGALETLVKEHPGSPLTPLGMGDLATAYEVTGRKAEGERMVWGLVERYPATEAAYESGRALLERFMAEGRPEEAVGMGKRLAAGASPGRQPDARVDYGMALASAQRFGEARREFEEAARLATEALEVVNAAEKSEEEIERAQELIDARQRATAALSALSASQVREGR